MQLAFPFVPLLEAYVPEKRFICDLIVSRSKSRYFSLAQERYLKKQWLIELIRRAQNPDLC